MVGEGENGCSNSKQKEIMFESVHTVINFISPAKWRNTQIVKTFMYTGVRHLTKEKLDINLKNKKFYRNYLFFVLLVTYKIQDYFILFFSCL